MMRSAILPFDGEDGQVEDESREEFLDYHELSPRLKESQLRTRIQKFRASKAAARRPGGVI